MRWKARSIDDSCEPDNALWISLILPRASASLCIRLSAGSRSRMCCLAAALASVISWAGWANAEIAAKTKAAETSRFLMMNETVRPRGKSCNRQVRTDSRHSLSRNRLARRRHGFRDEGLRQGQEEQRRRLRCEAPVCRQEGGQRRSIVDDF